MKVPEFGGVSMKDMKPEPRTKAISATFTTEEFEAIQRAALQTDRRPAGLVRYATLLYLKEIGLLQEGSIDEES
jgi:hypothetical protein